MVHPVYPRLFTKLELGNLVLPNRFVMGSMHTGLEELGDWDRVATFYAARARGGVSLIVTGGMAPNEEGAVFPGAAGLFNRRDIDNHRDVTDRVHGEGGRIAMQILHAGRCAYSRNAVAPSPIRSPISPFTPRELDADGIEKQLADFVTAALRAQEAGYDGVEVMGSEGYLLNQFLVTRTNKRQDEWGGEWRNRMRLPVEVVSRIRRAVGENFILIYRLSLIDLIPEGSNWDEIVDLAKATELAGASAISSGIGWHEARIPTIATSVPRGAFSWLTKKLMGEVRIPLITSNRINSPENAEAILTDGCADLVSMARPFLADPDFVIKARDGRARQIAPCIACNQACLDHTFAMKLTSCLVNPRACHETELIYSATAKAKKVAIVGSGPAGLSAAIVGAQRGHDVTLFEQDGQVGGQLNLAKVIPGKEEFRGLVDWYRHQLEISGVEVRLNQKAEASLLDGFDEIIIATGVTPRDPQIKTSGSNKVLTYVDVLRGKAVAGQKVAIIGAGGIGFDVAEFLSQHGKSSTGDLELWKRDWGISAPWTERGGLADAGAQAEMSERQIVMLQRKTTKPGAGLGKTTGWIHRETLRKRGIRMLSGVSYLQIGPRGLQIVRAEAAEVREWLDVDNIILCAGQIPERNLADALIAMGRNVHIIGGAFDAGELDAKRAIDQGSRLAAQL